ncbi:MAG TPA: hypothetical protein VE843_18270 [Ktedonobacteraceae bacterium]|nr:hypothetical protein [Ktedonobacteraceae bacterium]
MGQHLLGSEIHVCLVILSVSEESHALASRFFADAQNDRRAVSFGPTFAYFWTNILESMPLAGALGFGGGHIMDFDLTRQHTLAGVWG